MALRATDSAAAIGAGIPTIDLLYVKLGLAQGGVSAYVLGS